MPMILIIIMLALIVFWIIGINNRMVKLRNRRENAFADIDVQLKQRHDLVPQLVDTVKGYATHERELLTKITEARTAAMQATSIENKIVAEKNLSSELQGLKVAVENYPDLKANQNFLQLQEELSDIENKLAAARRFFNIATTEYNNSVEIFPANLIASQFGFHRATLFDLGNEVRDDLDSPPTIKF